MQFVLDITVSHAIAAEIKDKRRKPVSGIKAQIRKVSKLVKHSVLCRAEGMSYRPMVFES